MAGTTSRRSTPSEAWAPYPPDPAWVRSRTRVPRAYGWVEADGAYAPELAAGGLWLFGDGGCGKTALVHAIRLWWDGSHVAVTEPDALTGVRWCGVRERSVYVLEDEMVDRLEQAGRSWRADFSAELAQYAEAPLLCVDDAGEAEPTKAAYKAWYRVLTARSEAGLPTVAASRSGLGDFCEAFARSRSVRPAQAGRLGELVRRSMVPRRVRGRADGPGGTQGAGRRELGVVLSRRNRVFRAATRRRAPRRRTALRGRWRGWRAAGIPVPTCLLWAAWDVRAAHPAAAGLCALAVAAACVWVAVTAWMGAVHGG